MPKHIVVFAAFTLMSLVLSACNAQTPGTKTATDKRDVQKGRDIAVPEDTSLNAWWSFFEDEVMSRLITSAISLNNDHQPTTVQIPDAYLDPEIDLIHLIADEYLRYRYVQNQENLLRQYRQDITAILDYEGYEPGTGTNDSDLAKLDQERSVLEATLRDYKEQQEKSKKKITNHSRLLHEYVDQILKKDRPLPKADIAPFLAAEATNILFAADIIQARTEFIRQAGGGATPLNTAHIFPDMSVNGLFGIDDTAFINTKDIWKIKSGSAFTKLNLSTLEAEYSGQKPYENFKAGIKSALTVLERKIVSFNHIQAQKATLSEAATEAIAQYQNGVNKNNIRDIYKTRIATLRAEFELNKSLLEIYRYVGVY